MYFNTILPLIPRNLAALLAETKLPIILNSFEDNFQI
jgi:hypothetical protein